MAYPAEVYFLLMLCVQWALGDSTGWHSSCSDGAIQATSVLCLCCVNTHLRHRNMAGELREWWISLAFFIVSSQKWYTSLSPTVCQLNLVPQHPQQGVWETWGARGYPMRIRSLMQCDNDGRDNGGNHLWSPNHHASPSPTLCLPTGHSVLYFTVRLN